MTMNIFHSKKYIALFSLFLVLGLFLTFSILSIRFQPPSFPSVSNQPSALKESGSLNVSTPYSTDSVTTTAPPYYGYTTFKAPSDPELPIDELSTYINFLHIRQKTYYDRNTKDFVQLVPSEEDLQRVRGTNIKLILKLDQHLVEPISKDVCCSDYGIPSSECTRNICGFNEGELKELKNTIDPYKDVIEAIYVVNEPYKPKNNYTEDFLRDLVQKVRDIFPGYKMYVNFLSPYYRSLKIPGEFPNIPENIDLIAFDAYFAPSSDQEAWYKRMIGNDIDIIKQRANGRPVIFSSLAYREDNNPPKGPDNRPELYQAQWDYEIYQEYGLAGLRWFFYDKETPEGGWYGASYWPDLIEKHKEIGRNMLGLSSAPTIFLPFVTKSQDLGTGIKIIQDIPYGDNANGEANLLDLYLPDQSVGKVPVVIWIHGGGLTTGNKSLASQGEALVKEGYALAAINYRLTPDYYLPTQIYDAKAAVRWVRANAEQYNLDPDHIGVLGGSAGAMIAASLGTSGGVAELEGSVGNNPNYSSRVQAAVALAGVYDLFNFYKDKVSSCQIGKTEDYDRCFLEWFLGCSLVDESCWNDLKLGSAISYVSADDPPFFLCIGQDDPTPKGSEDHTNFNQALLDAGVDSTLIMPPNTPHGQCFNNAYDQILDFLNTNLKQ